MAIKYEDPSWLIVFVLLYCGVCILSIRHLLIRKDEEGELLLYLKRSWKKAFFSFLPYILCFAVFWYGRKEWPLSFSFSLDKAALLFGVTTAIFSLLERDSITTQGIEIGGLFFPWDTVVWYQWQEYRLRLAVETETRGSLKYILSVRPDSIDRAEEIFRQYVPEKERVDS